MQEIRYLKHYDIDKKKWDECITNAPNGNIYGLSWYLDVVSPNWDALVMGDYVSFMPLTWRKKYFIKYLFQHDLAQQLGIFGIVSDTLIDTFLNHILQKFKYIDIRLNHNNTSGVAFSKSINKRTNLVIYFEKKSIKEITNDYSSNAKKNIKKAIKYNTFGWSENSTLFIDFVEKINPTYFSKDLKQNYKAIIKVCKAHNMLKIILAKNQQGKIVAGAFLTIFRRRLTLLLPVSSAEGKDSMAMSGVINFIITTKNKDFSILDFEGSDVAGIKQFYKSFGTEEENYQRYKVNKLIWPLNVFKK